MVITYAYCRKGKILANPCQDLARILQDLARILQQGLTLPIISFGVNCSTNRLNNSAILAVGKIYQGTFYNWYKIFVFQQSFDVLGRDEIGRLVATRHLELVKLAPDISTVLSSGGRGSGKAGNCPLLAGGTRG